MSKSLVALAFRDDKIVSFLNGERYQLAVAHYDGRTGIECSPVHITPTLESVLGLEIKCEIQFVKSYLHCNLRFIAMSLYHSLWLVSNYCPCTPTLLLLCYKRNNNTFSCTFRFLPLLKPDVTFHLTTSGGMAEKNRFVAVPLPVSLLNNAV